MPVPCPGNAAKDVGMLTERESEVAALVARGLQNKAVARQIAANVVDFPKRLGRKN
jgi:DNA-binding NarL/FixJ family response regulator